MSSSDSKPRPSFVKGYALQTYSSAEEGIKIAAQNDYQYWYIDGSLEGEMPNYWNAERVDEMLQSIDTLSVKPIYHGNFKVPLASDMEELRAVAVAYTKKEIDLAAELTAPLIIHGGGIVEPRLVQKAKKQGLENYLRSIDELQTYARKKNVEIFLENLSNYKKYRPFHYIFTHAEEFDYVLARTDAKLLLDIGHANIGNDSPLGIFENYHRRIAGMSLSNNNGLQDQHLSLEKGSLNYGEIIAAIHFSGWQGIVAFETRDASPAESVAELEAISERCLSLEEPYARCANG